MQIKGKLIGFALGFLFLGPIGLGLIGGIIGAIIGHRMDVGFVNFQSFHPEAKRAARQTFSDVTFSVMGHIAKADGRVCENEIRVARAIMDKIGLNASQRERAMSQFSLGKSSDFNLDVALDQLAKALRGQRSLLRMFLEIQLQATYANSTASPRQQAILQAICRRFAIPQLNFDFFDQFRSGNGWRFHAGGSQQQYQRQQYAPQQPYHSLDEAYNTLGVSRGASKSEIKRAYRKLMSENHPDKLVAKGLPEEMIKLATEKTQAIQKAYDTVCKAKA